MLLIGYGNFGCGDDGLGLVLLEWIVVCGLFGWNIDMDYQFVVEYVLIVSEYDLVVFVDVEMGLDSVYLF